jgi:hypothetical protein
MALQLPQNVGRGRIPFLASDGRGRLDRPAAAKNGQAANTRC